MSKVYLIQVIPCAEVEFLLQYGKIVYKTDYISSLYGVESALDLRVVFKDDPRIVSITVWDNFTFSI